MSSKFTDDSIELRNFMFPKMETYNKNSLKKLYNHLDKTTLKNVKIVSYEDDIHINNGVKKDLSSPYMGNKIKEYVNGKLEKIATCKLMIGMLNITLRVYYKNEDVKQFISRLIQYIRFISSIADISLINLEINYYLTDFKKLLNKNINLIKDQVNSGSCLIKGAHSAWINIWRKEEILKVTLHELIHAFGFSKYSDTEGLIDHYNKRYNINTKTITSDEAYTEIWANILNCYLISQTTKKDPLKFFITMISLERSYSIYLAQKILHRKGINKQDINKDTHVFAYYIIRAEIYERFSKFIEHCEAKNKDYINITNGNEIIQFLLNNNQLKQDNRKFNNINKNKFTYKTLRMTVNELSAF